MNEQVGNRDPIETAAGILRRDVAVRPGLATRTRAREIRARRWRALRLTVVPFLIAILLLARDGSRPGRVTFAVEVPEGSDSVSLVGDFTDWEVDRVLLKKGHGNRWQVTLDLPPGLYRFAYVTGTGEWLSDPGAAPAFDSFDRPTSTILVTE